MKDAIKLKGLIELKLIRDGKIIKQDKIKNVITNASLAEVSGLVGDTGSKTAFTYLAVGTGTTAAAAGDTALETEETGNGLARASATVSQQTTNQTSDTLQLLKAWTASGSVAITECGALNASSDGTLLGHQVFDAYNVVSGDIFQLTYQFIFS